MYDNIGRKLKGLATAFFIIGSVITVIIGFLYIASSEFLILTGVLYLVLGPLASWCISLVLYGFGELIDKISDIEVNTRRKKKSNKQEMSEAELYEKEVDLLEASYNLGMISKEDYQTRLSDTKNKYRGGRTF